MNAAYNAMCNKDRLGVSDQYLSDVSYGYLSYLHSYQKSTCMYGVWYSMKYMLPITPCATKTEKGCFAVIRRVKAW